MELSNFISSTLIQIVTGVDAAQRGVALDENLRLLNQRPEINPRVAHNQKMPAGVAGTAYTEGPAICFVEFDVALSVVEKASVGGGSKVSVLGSGANFDGAHSSSATSAHRVKFSVPISFSING